MHEPADDPPAQGSSADACDSPLPGENARVTAPADDVDELTSLPNRRAVLRYLEVRAGSTATVVLLDIRGFMSMNDSFGQAAADVVLTEVADALRFFAPRVVLLARVSGTEFAALGTGDEASQAAALAEDLRAATQAVTAPTGMPLVASVGVATGSLGRSLLRSAEDDLYRDKASRPPPFYE